MTRLILASVMGLTMLAGAPVAAHAQQDGKDNISMDMQEVDVREALRALFKSVDKSYSVAPEVQGTVTLSLKNVHFDTALQNILKQVDATYRLIAGVYEIIKREEPKGGSDPGPIPELPKDSKVRRRIRLMSADPMFIATILGSASTNFTLSPEISTVIKTRGSGQGGGGFGNGFGNGNNSFGGGNGFGNGNNNFGNGNNNLGGGNNFGGNSGRNGGGGPGGGPHG